jgi:hypothetical protein
MRKLQLKIEDLRVTSFDTHRTPIARGTVQANNLHPATTIYDLTCAQAPTCGCPPSDVLTCDGMSVDTDCRYCA